MKTNTGTWKEVLRESKAPERPAELKTRSENPALEWNIASVKPPLGGSVILLPLVKKVSKFSIFKLEKKTSISGVEH